MEKQTDLVMGAPVIMVIRIGVGGMMLVISNQRKCAVNVTEDQLTVQIMCIMEVTRKLIYPLINIEKHISVSETICYY